jgi:AmmeMemoRadiSam system protein B
VSAGGGDPGREHGDAPADTQAAGPSGEVRPAAAAGAFYPADPGELAAAVDALVGGAEEAGDEADARPRALVVPHAGYRYSGPVAAAAYALLRAAPPARLVLLGPAHFVPLTGFAVPRAAAWQTPLGPVPVDPAARDHALSVPAVQADDGPHAPEHALEVQLPFLLRLVGPVPVLPVAVAAPPAAVADLLDAVVDADTLVVASTDLSHYLDEAEARARDARTVEAVLRLSPDLVTDGSACGAHALRGLLGWAARASLAPRLLTRATSADAGGSPDRVVGYASFAFEPR